MNGNLTFRHFLSVGEWLFNGGNPELNVKAKGVLQILVGLIPPTIQRVYVGTGLRHFQALAFLPDKPTIYAPIFGVDAVCLTSGHVILGNGQTIETERLFTPRSAAERAFKELPFNSLVVGDLSVLNQFAIIATAGGVTLTSPLLVSFGFAGVKLETVDLITADGCQKRLFSITIEVDLEQHTDML